MSVSERQVRVYPGRRLHHLTIISSNFNALTQTSTWLRPGLVLWLEGKGQKSGGAGRKATWVSRCASLHCNVAKIYDACDTVNSCSTPKHISNVWHDSNSDTEWGRRAGAAAVCSTDCVTFYVTVVYLLPDLVPPFDAPVCRQANNNVKYVRRFAIHTQKWMSAAHLNRNADCCVGSHQPGQSCYYVGCAAALGTPRTHTQTHTYGQAQ